MKRRSNRKWNLIDVSSFLWVELIEVALLNLKELKVELKLIGESYLPRHGLRVEREDEDEIRADVQENSRFPILELPSISLTTLDSNNLINQAFISQLRA